MTDLEILKQFGERIVPELKSVSKGFANSIEAEYTDTSMTIYASPYIRTLIDGRGPTRSGAKRGSQSLQQILLSWIERHSIKAKPMPSGKIPTPEQLSFMMARSIHRRGTLLYQRGGGNNIFDTIITNDRIENLLNLFGQKYLTEIKSINIK
jgi:hypothetical protein